MRATKLRHTQAKCRCLIASLTIIVNSQKKSNCFEGALRKNFSERARRGKRGPKVRGKPLCLASGRLPFRLRTRFPQVRSFEGKHALSPRSAFGQVFSFPDDPFLSGIRFPRGLLGGFSPSVPFLGVYSFPRGTAVFADILFPGRLLIKYLIPEGPPFCRVFAPPESLPFGRRAHIKSRSVRADAGRTRRSKEGRRGLL